MNSLESKKENKITLTESAATQVQKLHSENATEGQRLRILIVAGGCSGFEYGMSFDEEKEGDHVIESNGVEFLVDPTSMEYMNGSIIDFDDGLSGRGFEVRNPNATSTCGCGKSFS